MKRFILALIPLTIVLAGCGGPEVRSGTVINKTYTPDSGYFMMETVGQIQVPVWEDVPEEWTVTLKNCNIQHDGDKCPTEDWNVSEEEYNRITIGQELTIN